jgi:hypothetical protein
MVDERTPLLLQPKPIAPPSLLPFPTTTKRTSSSSPTCSTLRSNRLDEESTTIPRDVDGDDVNLSFSKLLKIFASLQTGHLPSTVQFINLTNYFLNNSQWLAPQAQDSYVLGVRVGQLSVKGEKVKTSMREFIESLRELFKLRNPDIYASDRKGKEREVTTGGDGWQEFHHRLKQSTGLSLCSYSSFFDELTSERVKQLHANRPHLPPRLTSLLLSKKKKKTKKILP